MPWSQIREATDEDRARLELAAARFIKLHRLEGYTLYPAPAAEPTVSASFALERVLNRWGCLFQTDPALHQRLTQLWRAEAGRVLRDKDASGIVSGYVVGWRKP